MQVASFIDKDQNHIEMGLHVFFGCYHNLFRLMRKCGVLQNLLVKASRPCHSDLASDFVKRCAKSCWLGESNFSTTLPVWQCRIIHTLSSIQAEM